MSCWSLLLPFWAAFCPMSCWSLLLPSSELPSLSSSHPMAFPSPAQNSSTVIRAEQARHSGVAAMQQEVTGPSSVRLAIAPWMVSLALETKVSVLFTRFCAPDWTLSPRPCSASVVALMAVCTPSATVPTTFSRPSNCWSLLLPSSELPSFSSHPTAPSPAQYSSTVTPAEHARHSAVAAMQQGVGGSSSSSSSSSPSFLASLLSLLC